MDRFAPTTKYCPKCGNINKDITLADRTYVCPICGYTAGRDIHSANNMIIMSKIIENQINLVPMGHRDFKPVVDSLIKPVEINTSNNYETKLSSMVDEAGRLQPEGCN